jgi:hypothetical protein
MLNMLIDSEEVSIHLAKKFGVPQSLIRSKEERRQIIALMQQQQQQGEQLGPQG